MKKIIIILDGLGDLTYKQLNHKSPLEYAKTPYMDFLACIGKTGFLYPIKDIAPESDEAMLALLGYDVFKVHRGRGPIEAMGSNIKFKKGDIVARANFANLLGDKVHHNRLKDVRSVPTNSELKKVQKIKLNNIKYYPTVKYRGVIVIKDKLSPKVSNSHPGYKIIKNYVSEAQKIKNKKIKVRKIKPLEKKAQKTADLLNEFTKKVEEILKNKTLLIRGVGNELPKLKKLNGKWAVMSEMPMERAIGKLSGMDIKHMPEKLEDCAKEVIKHFKKYDNIYLQIKGPDIEGHRGHPLKKAKEIEKIDKQFIKPLIEKLNLTNTIICITGDHATPCSRMAHSEHPCPLLISGKGKDKTTSFSEKVSKKGSLKKVEGKNLLKLLK